MRPLALVLVAAAALAGCGLGPGSEREGSPVKLVVTRDFGTRMLTTVKKREVRESDTVMRLLGASAKLTTRYGGGFVQSINGIAGSQRGGRRDWFYFVNGIEADTGAGDRKLAAGDVVQWDYRRWDATPRVPAIVGAFPEPFVHGQNGKRYPTRIECSDLTKACDAVRERLDDAGVIAGSGSLGAEARGGVMRVEVGTLAELERLQDLSVLGKGPGASGVYARVRGGALDLLDTTGRVVRRAPPGTGLVAAILPDEQQPLWVVTGVDEAGVQRAAALLDPAKLRNAYAVAVTPQATLRLPLEAAG